MDVKLCWTCSDSPRSQQTPPLFAVSPPPSHSWDGNFAAGMQKRKMCANTVKHPQLEPLNSFLMGLSRKRARVRLRPETKSFHLVYRLGNWNPFVCYETPSGWLFWWVCLAHLMTSALMKFLSPGRNIEWNLQFATATNIAIRYF